MFTVDVVKRWKLTNIPVRWQHLMPKERSRHSECKPIFAQRNWKGSELVA